MLLSPINSDRAVTTENRLSNQPLLKSRVMSRERILVVDDEEDLLELVNYNLSREGYRVDTVGTGEAALASARKNLPDLIVLDLLLRMSMV